MRRTRTFVFSLAVLAASPAAHAITAIVGTPPSTRAQGETLVSVDEYSPLIDVKRSVLNKVRGDAILELTAFHSGVVRKVAVRVPNSNVDSLERLLDVLTERDITLYVPRSKDEKASRGRVPDLTEVVTHVGVQDIVVIDGASQVPLETVLREYEAAGPKLLETLDSRLNQLSKESIPHEDLAAAEHVFAGKEMVRTSQLRAAMSNAQDEKTFRPTQRFDSKIKANSCRFIFEFPNLPQVQGLNFNPFAGHDNTSASNDDGKGSLQAHVGTEFEKSAEFATRGALYLKQIRNRVLGGDLETLTQAEVDTQVRFLDSTKTFTSQLRSGDVAATEETMRKLEDALADLDAAMTKTHYVETLSERGLVMDTSSLYRKPKHPLPPGLQVRTTELRHSLFAQAYAVTALKNGIKTSTFVPILHLQLEKVDAWLKELRPLVGRKNEVDTEFALKLVDQIDEVYLRNDFLNSEIQKVANRSFSSQKRAEARTVLSDIERLKIVVFSIRSTLTLTK